MCTSVQCDNNKIFMRATQKCECPNEAPFEYNKTCNKCQQNQYFIDDKCIACWEGSYYNP